MRTDIENLRNLRWDDLDKKFQKKLVTFCSNLDEEGFPEAARLVDGRYKTLQVFGRICQKLKRKRSSDAKKKLKEAEKMVLAMNSLKGGKSSGPRGREQAKSKRGFKPQDVVSEHLKSRGQKKKPERYVEGPLKVSADGNRISKDYDGYRVEWKWKETQHLRMARSGDTEWGSVYDEKHRAFFDDVELAVKKDPEFNKFWRENWKLKHAIRTHKNPPRIKFPAGLEPSHLVASSGAQQTSPLPFHSKKKRSEIFMGGPVEASADGETISKNYDGYRIEYRHGESYRVAETDDTSWRRGRLEEIDAFVADIKEAAKDDSKVAKFMKDNPRMEYVIY